MAARKEPQFSSIVPSIFSTILEGTVSDTSTHWQEHDSSSLPAPKILKHSALAILSPHDYAESRTRYSAHVVDLADSVNAMHDICLNMPAPPASSTPAPATKGRRRKLAALPKRSIKEATSPLSAPTPTPQPSEFQFKPSEPNLLPSSTLHAKSIFATDVSHSSSSVFYPLTPRAPAPSSFLSLALAKDGPSITSAVSSTPHATSTSSPTTDMSAVSRPSNAHPLFGKPAMMPLPSRRTSGHSEVSTSQDQSSRPSVVLDSSSITRMLPPISVASDESEGFATVFDHPSTLSSSQPSTDSSPLLPAWSPTSPPPLKGRRRKVAPLPSRHLANEPTFPTFNEKYSREPSFTPTSPPSRAPSLEPAFSDASSSPEPDTLPTPPSSPPGFSFSSPVILSPESHVSEPLLFSLAKSRSEHDNGGFHFGSPPPTSKPLQKGRLDFGFPSIDQTLQGSSASFSFSFDRPS
ncbi:uncharacterized protein STEHIDRAFT_106814 [Stereum hirsutum FP-91666 SS1]|uniref:uncharacterized protein n=1 Tax=Stereum hirsutum (strain FP-91666) TaxID=721885 RepID=UPI000440F34A|nr:uncharacterized protein STEHIDRAFT_106814 [Stereum hirsutum FP-91666 SS1]EIM92232.1 hypothetical protein STEHIDRAFT_106814 [Stereum hirsutum FP-91666 SS1]